MRARARTHRQVAELSAASPVPELQLEEEEEAPHGVECVDEVTLFEGQQHISNILRVVKGYLYIVGTSSRHGHLERPLTLHLPPNALLAGG